MKWLVTGGAGYIGAHVVRAMLASGESAVVLDDLSTGTRSRVPDEVPLVVGTILDRALLDDVLAEHRPDGIVHIAGKKQVGESMARPLYYYEQNVEGLRILLAAAVDAGVSRFVFSSSAAVYGMPDTDLVDEDYPSVPLSPYGQTKLAGEWLIRTTAEAHGIAYASLRYFNVAGAAAPELADEGVFNLIPMVLERLTADEPPRVFGADYATPDGTCVRDYIHVADLADAHVVAARRLATDPKTALTLNVGRGTGTSVREVIDLVARVTGRTDLPPVVVDRRPGDPACVVGRTDRIAHELGWTARYDIEDMVSSAWEGWQRRH
ncbi:UDP-glucose 4-epimerase GalE [Yinghuangia seranimata]|uniref:UDP-glucose 4-epimerase GalE n=1 Tax=Yinghuangia seranimata TaxID=408067 RepID=UPI00248AE5AB|nr:UDP-glucose 4-epimerase GalE [Yinghuangia seranimata]MDI2131706.1 UDP-glucose 4-epimerase GalE [Yinghuangia seranimata]